MYILLTEKVKLKWCSKTKYHYINCGYEFTKIGDYFEANINDVTKGSSVKVNVKCDYCGNIYETSYSTYLKTVRDGKNACKKCASIRTKETCLKKYGVPNVFCLEEIKEKSKITLQTQYGVSENISQSKITQDKIKSNNLLKYGVTNTSKLDSVKEKVKQSNREKFGVDYPMQSKEFMDRFVATSLEKYGTKYPCQNEEVKTKIKKTNIQRYGFENPIQNKDVLQKSIDSRYKHGNFTCSKNQYKLFELIGGKLNYPFEKFILDIAFPDEKIAVEWDGSGHDLSVRLGKISREQFIRNENYRNIFLFKNNWKLIRFISKKDIFPKNIIPIFDFCKKYIKNGGHKIIVDIDDNYIKYHNCTKNLNDIE